MRLNDDDEGGDDSTLGSDEQDDTGSQRRCRAKSVWVDPIPNRHLGRSDDVKVIVPWE